MFKIYFTLCLSFLFLGCQIASELLEQNIHPKNHNYKRSSSLLKECYFNNMTELLHNNKNELLKNSEQGLAYYYQEDSLKSNIHLDKAIALYRDNENKALFDLSTFLSQEYQGEGYDKVFLHNYKAINYLMLGNAESSRVEARNSNLIQQKEYQKLYNFKNKKIKEHKNSHLLSRYEKIFQNVNPKHNPYENPFAYYVSALSYAEDNDYDNALLDIRKAIKLMPSSEILQKKLKQYNSKKHQKSIELFFDIGQSPLKSQVKLEIKLSNNEKRMVYLPAFSLSISDVAYIELINSKGTVIERSSLLSDVNAIKINEFKEKLPTMVYLLSEKLALSVASKGIEARSKFLATLFNLTTTLYGQVDTLTWSLLPEKILAISFIPHKNEVYKLLLYSKNNKVLDKYDLNVLDKSSYRHFSIREEKICQ